MAMSTDKPTSSRQQSVEDECVCSSYGPNMCDYGGDHDEPLFCDKDAYCFRRSGHFGGCTPEPTNA